MNHMYYDASLYEALKGFGLLLKSGKEIITNSKDKQHKKTKQVIQ